MKKTVTVIVASLSFVFAAAATELPRYETFVGYQFTRFNTNLPVTATNLGGLSNFDAHGGTAQFIYNIDKWFGVVFDAGAVTNTSLNPLFIPIGGGSFVNPNFDTTVTHFVAGPRFTWHNESRFKPYAEALFGGSYGTASFRCDPGLTQLCGTNPNPINAPVSTRVQVSHTVYAMMIGGGLDIKVNKHVAFRPAGFDYYLTRPPTQAIDFFSLGRSDRNNWRYIAGVTFMFGAQ